VRYIETLFYQVKATGLDVLAVPSLTILTAALLAAIGGAAAFLPARRASRLDPSQVLRNE